MNKLFERLLKTRGVDKSFLFPEYEKCIDPMSLPDMNKAVNCIKKIDKNSSILIYGDYDVDGVTASVVMHDTLKLAGFKNIQIMLPDRFADGYGMSKKIIQKAKDQKINLVVTVDCGSNNVEIVDELNKNKIKVIVTDHHECGEKLPKALAVINPKRKDVDAPKCLRDLAGVGVAFELARALAKEGVIPDGQEKWLLDLVLIGTLCDNMEMSEENRRICYFGMKVLEKTRRPGLKELMRIARVTRLSDHSINFQIGPRLNAAGRMESAEKSLKLLLSTSKAEAAKLALELDGLNQTRKDEQNKALKEISDRGIDDEPVIVEFGEWHEGVLGIIAGRMVEVYKRPAFILTEVEEGICKGSGRSFGGFNLAEALCECQDDIMTGGGHSGACGVKLLTLKIADFKSSLNKFYKSLKLTNQNESFLKKEDLKVGDLTNFNLELTGNLRLLEPFGAGNREPIFKLENMEVIRVDKLGSEKQHLRVVVQDKDKNTLKLLAFFAPEEWMKIKAPVYANLWVRIGENEWNGIRSVEGQIENMQFGVVN